MSAIEYNSLLLEISQRLDELNVGRKLLVMCRGKVAPRNEENMQDVFSLFVELEQNGFLGLDKLEVLKDLLKGLKEWSLFGNVKAFQTKRKKYNSLLEKIILKLDELDCLEELLAICSDRIPEENRGGIEDVRSLLKELEVNDSLGIDRLEVLKEILTQKEKIDLLQEVEEFEERRNQQDEFEWRKAQAAAIFSSAISNLIGALNIKSVFKTAGGGIVIASALRLLRRACANDQLANAVSTCVLPAGIKLIQIGEGCVNLRVQAEDLSALTTLWSFYTEGTLKACLQALFVTDEMRELAGGEGVEVVVTIDEQEYEKARTELISKTQGSEGPVVQREEWQEKVAYIQSYLEQTKDMDTKSVTTETSDSGKPGSHEASSEIGIEEPSDFISSLCLRDLSDAVTTELEYRLAADPIAGQRFHQSFGLDARMVENISKLFPDTPVTLLRDVFEKLQLYDLVELLEKVKPRILRPALPLKEMDELLNANERPTKFFSKAEVLIIEYAEGATADDFDRIGSFCKSLNSQNQVTKVTTKGPEHLLKDLSELRKRKKEEELEVQLASMFFKERLEENREEIKQKKLSIEKTEEEIAAKKEELQRELKEEEQKFQMAVSTIMDKWISPANDEDRESFFFLMLQTTEPFYGNEHKGFLKTTRRYLKKKLALIPNTKLVIEDAEFYRSIISSSKKIPRETLKARIDTGKAQFALATILELLNKRWKTLDLISVLREAQRTLGIKMTSPNELFTRGYFRNTGRHALEVYENLSCLPRLLKMEQSPEPSGL